MADRDFDLRILKAGSHYLADVRSPDGEEANHAFELPISPERLDELFRGLGHPRKATPGGGSPEVWKARDFGRQLFETVFAGEIRDVFQRSFGRVEARGGDLRIRLRLARDVPELLDLPWELLFDRGRNRFLALEPATTLVRHLPVQQRIEPMRVAPPLRILVAISNPGQAGYPALDVEQEWGNLDQALRPLVNRGRVSLTRLDGVTQESLRQALKREACHVLHYIGHGGYDSVSETGLLVLEDKDRGARPCGASRLTYLLREQPALRLVVLNACEGGRSSRTDPFAGVAQSLVQGALPAVVAMQFPVTDAAAVVFASAFYEALASGQPVDLAVAEARREVNLRGEEGEIEWATPVLYMRGDGELFSFEERESVQPEPTTATPAPETGAGPTAEHDREAKAEPAKMQSEEAGKKPSLEAPLSLWKIAGPIMVLAAMVLGFILTSTLISKPGQRLETTVDGGPVADTAVSRPAPAPDSERAAPPAPIQVPQSPRIQEVPEWKRLSGATVTPIQQQIGVREIPTFNRQPLTSMAFSPNGTTLATGSTNRYQDAVQLWRVTDGKLMLTLNWPDAGDVRSVAFSPDGTTLAYAGQLGAKSFVRFCRITDGKVLRTLEGVGALVQSVAFSPDGSLLASGHQGRGNTVKLWRVADGTHVGTFQQHKGPVNGVAFSPDGATLASGSSDGTIVIWRVIDGVVLHILDVDRYGGVFSVALSPEGATLASGSGDTTVRLWRITDSTLLRTLKGHTNTVNSISFSPDGTMLASGSSDHTVQVWGVTDGNLLRTLEAKSGDVSTVAFSPDGTLLASAGGTAVQLWRWELDLN